MPPIPIHTIKVRYPFYKQVLVNPAMYVPVLGRVKALLFFG